MRHDQILCPSIQGSLLHWQARPQELLTTAAVSSYCCNDDYECHMGIVLNWMIMMRAFPPNFHSCFLTHSPDATSAYQHEAPLGSLKWLPLELPQLTQTGQDGARKYRPSCNGASRRKGFKNNFHVMACLSVQDIPSCVISAMMSPKPFVAPDSELSKKSLSQLTHMDSRAN